MILNKDDALYAEAEKQVGAKLNQVLASMKSGPDNNANFTPESMSFDENVNTQNNKAAQWFRDNLKVAYYDFKPEDVQFGSSLLTKESTSWKFNNPKLKEFREQLILKSNVYYALYKEKYPDEIQKVEALFETLWNFHKFDLAIRNKKAATIFELPESKLLRLFEYFDELLPESYPEYEHAKAVLIKKLEKRDACN